MSQVRIVCKPPPHAPQEGASWFDTYVTTVDPDGTERPLDGVVGVRFEVRQGESSRAFIEIEGARCDITVPRAK